MKTVRNDGSVLGAAALEQLTALRADMLRLSAGMIFHASASDEVGLPDAEDEETLVEVVNELKVAFNAHIASVCSATTGEGAHIAADEANEVTTEDAEDEATAITLVNALKAKYNAHRVLTTVHATADSTNEVTAEDADNLAKAIALANEIKAKLNAHFAGAFTHEPIRVIAP